MRARRQALQGVRRQPSTHIGLWFDRYLDEQNLQGQKDDKDGVGSKAEHIAQVQGMPVPAGYADAVKRLREDLAPAVARGQALLIEAKAEGRIAIGLGEKGVLENGLRLDYTWGVPVLPGSALKGVARAAARALAEDASWQEGGPSNRGLFGFTDADGKDAHIGRVEFLDAMWVPDGAQTTIPVHLDTMTVHHQTYYQGDANPTDADSPIPVPFATVSGTFLIALVLTRASDDAEWLDATAQLLKIGLTELGIGGKTNAGYGRVVFDVEEGLAKKRRAECEFAALSPEERFRLQHQAVIQSDAPAQAKWLLEHASAHLNVIDLMRDVLSAGLDMLRGLASGDDPRIAAKEAEIAAHEAAMPTKSSGLSKKALPKAKKKWIKHRDKLAKQLDQLKSEADKQSKDQGAAAAIVALFDEPAE